MEESFSSKKLFVRQSSGLVRNVSMTNALFFNVSAFIGTAIGWAITFFALGGPQWQGWGISSFAWMALLTGIACFFLIRIFAALTTAMPRSGGDYVFTSRIISPFWGWLESWTLAGSALTIIGFEIIVAVQNLRLAGIMLDVAYPGGAFTGAQNWFQDNLSKIVIGVVVMLLIAGVSILKVQTFHKVVTALAIFSVTTVFISLIGAFTIDPASMSAALPKLGTSTQAITDAATQAGWAQSTPDFSFIGILALLSMVGVILFQFIGFQFSSYIAGEVKGNVNRSVVIALTGALVLAVFMNSVYMDVLGNRFGFDMVNAWGYLYWFTGEAPLSGQPPFTPLLATAVHPGAWPIWMIVALGNITMNLLLCPVYAIFLSRTVLAWALDRQVPEWFSAVDDRTNAPLRVIILAVLVGGTFYMLTFVGLNLTATTFFGVLLGCLTWIMPGLNAILMPYRRPELFQTTGTTGKFLGLPRLVWYGILWLLFVIPVYLAAVVWPIVKGFTEQGVGFVSFSSTSGVGWAFTIVLLGIVVYYVMKFVNKSRGIESKMLFQELPPD